MTIEEKLDWILDKVRQGGFYPYREKGSHMEIIKVINELYGLNGNTHPDFHKCIHEWEQLEKILFDDDKLVESDLYKYWVLTVKGKMFEGYVRRKKRQSVSITLQSVQTWAIAVGTSLAGLYALFQLLSMLLKNFHCH